MTKEIKRYYLKFLLKAFFDKNKQSQEPKAIGRLLLPYLPHPKIYWLNGYEYMPHYYNRRWILRSFQGTHEPALENFIIRVVPRGSTVIDVGAQVGLISVLLAKKVGPQGRVISFEPNPYNYCIMNEVLQQNGLENVQTENKAIGIRNGFAVFKQITQAGYTQLTAESKDRVLREYEKMPIVRLDDFCAAIDVNKVDFIKIDIDGPDLEALIGANGILRSPFAPLLCVEVSQYWKNFGYDFSDAFAYLHQLDYRVFVAHRKKQDIIPIADPSSLPKHWGCQGKLSFNFYGWKPGIHDALVKVFLEQ